MPFGDNCFKSPRNIYGLSGQGQELNGVFLMLVQLLYDKGFSLSPMSAAGLVEGGVQLLIY